MLSWYQDTCDIVPFKPDARFSAEMLWNRVKGIIPPGRVAEMKAFLEKETDISLVYQKAYQLKNENGITSRSLGIRPF